MFGYPRDVAAGQELAELLIPAHLRHAHREGIARLLATGESRMLDRRLELVSLRANGTEFPVELIVTRVAGEKQPMFVGYIRDISERRTAEDGWLRAVEKYRMLVESAPVGIYQSDMSGRILTANPTLARILGFDTVDELVKRNMRDVYFDPAERDAIVAKYDPIGVVADLELVWKRRDGTPVRVQLNSQSFKDDRGHTLYFQGFVRDVTERAELEERLRQSAKMDAIGRLAGGVAHDFNNILTAITGYVDMLLDELPEVDPRRADVAEIRIAAERAAGLTRQLLAFSRKQVLEPRVINLNSVVPGLESMLRRLIREDIALEIVLSPELGNVEADPGQVEQVLLNLVVNARDAMPDGGSLTVATGNVILEQARSNARFAIPAGRYASLSVTDTGIGIDDATRPHLFEPFFTTKERAKGTGLGLATVYGVVKQSGGYIEVESQPGRGATFRVYLPIVDAPAAAATAAASEAEACGAGETLLVAEDEDAVRAMVSRALERAGFKVMVARDADEAERLARDNPGRIHLLITDVVMPGRSGRELAESLSRSRPGLKVLFMSGYTDDAIARHGVLEAGVAYLQKPFSPQVLARRVRDALDA